MIKLTCWGTRGSVPVSGPHVARHGGATTCLELELLGAKGPTPERVIVDCGTGLADLGRQAMARGQGAMSGVLYQTHLHWDHVQGFPFFAPLFHGASCWTLCAVEREGSTLRQVLDEQMRRPTFPVGLDILPARLDFEDLPQVGHQRRGQLLTRWTEVCHPSGSTAYRFEHQGCAVVFSGDVEVRQGCEQALIHLAQGADLLIMDAQYFEQEYAARQGWGHSTPQDAVRVALAAGVKHLLLTHHDPSHDDAALERKLQQARAAAAGSGLLVDNAHDGLTLTLAPRTASVHPGALAPAAALASP